MPDYANYMAPQFSRTDVNFQRVPLVDTSNPFRPQDIPTAEESLLVIHVKKDGRLDVDFDELLSELNGAFRSREDTLVVPGEQMGDAMEWILGPAIAALAGSRA